MRTASRGGLAALGLALALLLLGTAVQCGYDPSPADGKLGCSAKSECPEGYSCRADNKCWKVGGTAGTGGAAGTTGSGGATGGSGGAGGRAGSGGAGGAMMNLCGNVVGSDVSATDKLVGCWAFDAASTKTVDCGGAAVPPPVSLKGDYVQITPRAKAGTVQATYYCGWILDEGPAGNAATIEPGQSCMNTDPTSKAVFTWNGMSFTFTSVTADGKAATLDATIPASYVAPPPDNSTGNCTIKMTGRLAKQ